MSEIASAWVTLVPSARGFGAATSSAIGPQMATSGKSAGALFAKGMLLGVTAAVGASVALYKIGQTFDDLKDTIVVGTGASGAALDRLNASALRIGKTTPSSFDEIGVAVAGLNSRLGLTGKPLEAMASNILNLSRLTGTDLKSNIADMTRVFGDWGIAMKDQPKALDEIFTASQKTGAGINDLAQSVVRMGAPLRQFGFSFEEGLAIFGKWEKEGVNTQTVMAGLKIGLGAFSKAGLAPKKALDDVATAIKNAGSSGEANALAIKTFGQRAGPDMAAAIREGRFEIDSLVKGIAGSGGAISKADKNTRDFAESWQIFKNKVLVTLEPIATRVFSGFSTFAATALPKLASGFQSVSSAVGSFVADFRAGVSVGGQFAAAFSGISAVLLPLGSFMLNNKAAVGAFVGVILTVVTAVKVWTIAQALLNLVLTANPIGIVVVALAALAAGLVYAYQHSETFRNIVNAAFGAVKVIVGAVVGWFSRYVPQVFAVVVAAVKIYINVYKTIIVTAFNIVKTVVQAVVGFIGKYVPAVWNALVSAVKIYVNIYKTIITTAFAIVKQVIGTVGGVLKGLIDNFAALANAVRDKIGDVIGYVKALPGKAKAALGNLGTLLISAGADLIRGFVQGVRNAAGSLASAAIDAARGAVDGVKGFLRIGSPSKVFHEIGAFTMQGMKEGVDQGAPAVADAVKNAAAKMLEHLTSLRDKTKSVLDGIKSDFASLRDSIASAFTPDLFQATSGADFFSQGVASMANLEGLRKALKKLRGWGIDPQFLSSLFSSGNSALILDLAAGPRYTAVNDAGLFNTNNRLANQLGDQVAQNQYGKKIDLTNQRLHKIEQHLASLPKNIGREINGAVAHGQKKAS